MLWLEDVFIALDLDLELLLDGRNLDLLARLVELTIFDEEDGDVEVRLRVGGDGQVEVDSHTVGGDDFAELDGVAGGDDESVEGCDLGNDAEVRGIAGSVGLFVGDDLDGLGSVGEPIGLAAAEDPEPGVIRDSAAFGRVGGGEDFGAAGLCDGQGSVRGAARVGGDVSRGAVGSDGLAVGIAAPGEAEMNLGLDGLVVVVDGSNGEVRSVASPDRIAVGLDVDAVAAVAGEEMAAAGDFSVRLIRDAGFDEVVLIGVALGVVDFGLDGDRQFAVGVELAGLLGFLAGVVHVVIGGLVLVIGA